MPYRRAMVGIAAFAFIGLPSSKAQSTTREFWSETDVHVQHGERLRFIFQVAPTLAPQTHTSDVGVTAFVEVALRPLMRVELRHRNDVFRQRFFTFRTGYRRLIHFDGSGSEHRAIEELNVRYALPGRLVLSDRNRGEFRFIEGQPFSARYRNRLSLERDLAIGAVKVTPEFFDEYSYDTRYGTWARVRYTAGFLIPVGRHATLEPYLVWQINKQSDQRHNAVFGFTLNLYF